MNKRCWVSRQRLECAAQDFKFGQLRVRRPAEIYLGNTCLGSTAIFAARAHARFLLFYLCRAHEKCYQTRTSLVEYAVEHAYGSLFWNILRERVSCHRNICSKVRENSKWRVRSKLRSEPVEGRSCRRWALPESPAYPFRWRARRPHRPADRLPTSRRRISRRLTKSFSARKKFPT